MLFVVYRDFRNAYQPFAAEHSPDSKLIRQKGRLAANAGSTSTLITKCASDTRPRMRTAAKVFIYMKRLSTYIIRIITSERILKKKSRLMTHHTISSGFKSLFHHPPIRCGFLSSSWSQVIYQHKKKRSIHICISINIIPACFQIGKRGHPVERTSPFRMN